jgi:hypothetical protein
MRKAADMGCGCTDKLALVSARAALIDRIAALPARAARKRKIDLDIDSPFDAAASGPLS